MRRNRMATLRIFARRDAVCTPRLTMFGLAPEPAGFQEGVCHQPPGGM